jgi:hypothetical protein
MKAILIAVVILLSSTLYAFAQQDPDDPGIQDSIIVGCAGLDSGGTFLFIPIIIVTDDSVAAYTLPLTWIAPLGGVYAGRGTQYYYPLTSWDERYDTVMLGENYVRQVGWADLGGDPNPVLLTNGVRVNTWTLRFVVDPHALRQLIVLDTCWDERNGSVQLFLADGRHEITPAFQRGFIGFMVDVNESDLPGDFELSQNYPNPFNPSTEIAFTISKEGPTSLVIYDLLGREVRRLLDRTLESGNHVALWDGNDNNGVSMPSGVYFYRLSSAGFSDTKRMTLLR